MGEPDSASRRDGTSSIIPWAIASPSAAVQLGVSEAGGRNRGQIELVARRPPRSPAGRSWPARAGQALSDDLAHAVGAAELGQRVGQLPRRRRGPSGSASRTVRHSSVIRKALPPVSSCRTRATPRHLVSELIAGRAVDELRDLVGAQAAQAQPRHSIGAAQFDQRRRERLAGSRPRCRGTSSRSARARRCRRARDGAAAAASACPPNGRPRSRSPAGLRLPAATSRSATALCRRWRSVSGSAASGRRKPADALREIRQQARQLPAARYRRPRAAFRRRCGDELLERFDERPVRAPHDRVARAVEHERAAGRRLTGELAHEPALARSRLAADQRESQPSPSPRGISARSIASSRARPANGNDGVSRS